MQRRLDSAETSLADMQHSLGAETADLRVAVASRPAWMT
jgi:hypothetical protein